MTRHRGAPASRVAILARAVLAVAVLAVVIAGIPAVLVWLGRSLPIDLGALAPEALGRIDDGRLLLLAILGLAWGAWAATVASLAVETWAAIRRVPAPRIPGLGVPQRAAGALIAALTVALSPAVATAAPLMAGQPSSTPAGVAQTVTGHSDAGHSDAGHSDVGHSDAGHSDAGHSDAGHSATGQSVTSRTGVAQSEVGRAGVAQTGVGRAQRSGASGAEAQQGAVRLEETRRGSVSRARPAGADSLVASTPTGRPGIDLRSAVGAVTSEANRPQLAQTARSEDPAMAGSADLPTITTRRHDTLWMLAENHLGAGARYVEIVALNRNVVQPDGRSLGDNGRLYPGWTLRLPADARADVARPDVHGVVRGDTLWDIARDELGDPRRYPEIVAVNRGDLQPDGRRLDDPDLIVPGWVLEIPSDRRADDGASAGVGDSQKEAPSGGARSGRGPSSGGPSDGARSGGGPSSGGPSDGARSGGGPSDGASSGDASSGAPSPAASGASSPGAPSPGVPSPGVPSPGVPSPSAPSPGVPSPGASAPGAPSRGAPSADASASARPSKAPEPAASPGRGDSSPSATARPSATASRVPSKPAAGSPTARPDQSATAGLPPLDRGPQSPAARGSGSGSRPTPSPAPLPPIDRSSGEPGSPSPSPGASRGRTSQAEDSPRPTRARSAGHMGVARGTSAAVVPTSEPPADCPQPSPQAPPVTSAAAPSDALLPLAAGGSLTALVLAGIGADLVRRRRQFQRFRRPGERLPGSGPTAADMERAVRAAAREPGLDLLERSLGQLAEQSQATGVAVPRTRLVLLTETSVTLELAEPAPEAIAPFRAAGPLRWELDDALLTVGTTEVERAYPGLLALGSAGATTVLINLEAVGTLGVVGETDAIADVTRALSAELALGSIAGLTERTLCLLDPAIAAAVEPGTLAVLDDPRPVAASLSRRISQPGPRRGGEAGDPLEVVLTDRPLGLVVPPWRGCALIAVGRGDNVGAVLHVGGGSGRLLPYGLELRPQGLSVSSCAAVVELLRATDLPEAGAGAAGPGAPAKASGDGPVIDLRGPAAQGAPTRAADDGPAIDLRGSAATQPGRPGAGIDGDGGAQAADSGAGELGAGSPGAGASGAQSAGAAGAHGPAGAPSGGAAGAPGAGPGVGDAAVAAAGAAGAAGTSGAGAAGADDPAAGLAGAVRDSLVADPPPGDVAATGTPGAGAVAPRVLLLGEVQIENAHGRAESSRIGRLAETTAFVLLHPGSRPSQLQSALWPGRRANPQTCRQMISRTRTWLGRTEQGDSYLMPFVETEGRLRLRQEVGSDWADFQRLAAIGLADPDDTESLASALALVRGRPFGAVASRELPWADLFINEMISLVADVAHELAVRHEQAGRRAAARDAALRGLLTECESEVLEALVARLG